MALMFDPFVTASAIADCVCANLKDPARGADVWSGDCCIIPGASASWDKCCENAGTMWVSMLSGHPTQSFPTPAGFPLSTCGSSGANQAVEFEVGVVRCVCAMLEDGSECGCDQREVDAARVMGDLQAVLSGLSCCFADSAQNSVCGRTWQLNSWRSIGRLGGCAGIVVNILVEVDGVCCPEGV